MKTQWFTRLGWHYLPVSLPGIIITFVALAFCVQVFAAVDRHSHSASDTLYGVFPFFASTFQLFDWIAGRTSHKTQIEIQPGREPKPSKTSQP